jgi:hypothetical protein
MQDLAFCFSRQGGFAFIPSHSKSLKNGMLVGMKYISALMMVLDRSIKLVQENVNIHRCAAPYPKKVFWNDKVNRALLVSSFSIVSILCSAPELEKDY